jgi:hypothetical protein
VFFQICNSKLDNFPVNYQHKNLIVNLDHGWHTAYDEHDNVLFYKGYLDNGKIEDFILDIARQEEPFYTGNFCLLKCFDQGISIKTDRYRSFPICYLNGNITNLNLSGEQVYTDSFVMLTNNLEKIESKFALIEDVSCATLSFDSCVDKIDEILTNKLKVFFSQNTLPVHVFLSGGIDTTTLYSYIVKLNVPHKLIDYLHTDFDYFYLKNHHTLSQHWGYRQFHYWTQPCVLVSGTPGDEFTVRSPTTANMLLKYHQTSIADILEQHSNSLHFKYFEKYKNIFEAQRHLLYPNLNIVVKECLNIILNDYQHWHLGSTLSYTPLRDIGIFTTIASLAKEDLVNQIFNSIVQKALIRKNAPHLLDCLSTNKNSSNFLENLVNIYTAPLPDNSG